MTKQSDLKRRVRARMSKTGESYAAARAQVVAEGERSRTLHVTNGGSTVLGLRGTRIEGTIMAWRDALHEGPVPDVPDAELRVVRARFLAGENAADVGTEAEYARRDRMLAEHRDGEYVLWFEADLYDQLQLVQILAQLQALDVAAERITLICIGEHLGIAHFGGLGELTPEQLSRLPAAAATPLTAAALAHAERAWRALRSADPTGLNEIAATPSPELRFVAEAFDRLSREYPSTRDGLSLTERRILGALVEGPQTAGSAFVRAAARETRPFLGDTWCYDRIRRLRDAPTPLLETDPPTGGVDRHSRVALTDAGRRVLDGHDDHVTRNGVDRWIGGVHLSGRTVPWRWNEGTESITAG
jgi:hypothetical protein